jgi:NAD-dependent DNA ligase
MRLMKPAPGEIADRQTILNLKAKFGEAKGINVQPFIDENELCQQYLERNWFPDLRTQVEIDEYDKLFAELEELNTQVWQLTDQSHTLMEAPDRHQALANQRAAEVLFSITEMNDRRASIVYQINGLFALKVQEKIFA